MRNGSDVGASPQEVGSVELVGLNTRCMFTCLSISVLSRIGNVEKNYFVQLSVKP
jgi:hypothetical protein